MKTYFLHAVLASSLLLAYPAFAQNAASAAPAADAPVPAADAAAPAAPAETPEAEAPAKEANRDLYDANAAVSHELMGFFDRKESLQSRVEHLEGFAFSDETKKKLVKVFGNDNPLHFKVQKLDSGDTNLSVGLDSLEYKNPDDGSVVHTAPATANITFMQQYTKLHGAGALPSMTYKDGHSPLELVAKDFTVVEDAAKGAFDFWYGTVKYKIGSIIVDGHTPPIPPVAINDITLTGSGSSHGALADFGYELNIQSVDADKITVGPIHQAIRLVNVDAKSLRLVVDQLKGVDANNPDPLLLATTGDLVKKCFVASLKNKVALEVDDISVQYHGLKATVNGRVAFANANERDVEAPDHLLKKLTAKFTVRVPKEMVLDVARTVAAKVAEKQQNQQGSGVEKAAVEVAASQMIEQEASKEIDDLIKKRKYAHMEQGTIVSVIEFKSGVLYLDHKKFSFR